MWNRVKRSAGAVQVADEAGLGSAGYYVAIKELVQQEIEQLESRAPAFHGELDLSEIKRELAL